MEQVTAKLSRLPISGFKVRLIADQIRGKQVGEALEILKFSKKASARNVKKLLDSAIANAEHNNSSDIDELIVQNVLIDEGPYGKRHRPRARGRVNQILKRTSHITIVVSDKEDK